MTEIDNMTEIEHHDSLYLTFLVTHVMSLLMYVATKKVHHFRYRKCNFYQTTITIFIISVINVCPLR